ncbi:MAG TPA: DUF58 domain-containing protein [Candidatus Syntrophosphaera sp.]|nr:DUF58 domain-containing protein [Candidatus Syntrophosphaera sp.]HOU71740.1 DUF58 domain-containing protein [Candidatus Syntrophosphaera sp.]HPK83807.1 DUF58 domain-containing protein [Candidatus Syntrophosphaera sp.]HQG94068.1 DUF58 domain-containing protein [Candidatus Syntrophosphaera sp.]HQK29316.1 DUF58 domain-containing protein [Candidatus Syntrophosphaera sp.]
MALLTEETAARLKRYQLQARAIVEGFLVGLHKSPYHGFSVEFSDHREYNSGDPVKNIDWKIVAKTERYYVKRFEEETNLRCYLILDHSRSMFYGSGESTKIDYACRLAAALAWLMVGQKDATGLITFNERITSMLPPKAYRGYLGPIFRVLAELEPKDSTRLLENLHQIASTIRKRSLIILISDLLDDPERVIEGLKHFRSQHHEVLVFHITDLQEDKFSFSQETEFVDSETGEKIVVNPWQIRAQYLSRYSGHINQLKAGCHQYQIEYNPVSTATPLEDLLLKYLLMRKKG